MSKWESLCTIMYDEDLIDMDEHFDLVDGYESPKSIVNFVFLQYFARDLSCVLTRYRNWHHLALLDDKSEVTNCFLFSTLKDLYEYMLKRQRDLQKKKKEIAKVDPTKAKLNGKKTRNRKKTEIFCPHFIIPEKKPVARKAEAKIPKKKNK